MTKKFFKLRDVAMIIACLAATTLFASCDKDNPQPLPDNGANITAFTFEGISGTAVIDKDALTVTATAKATVDLASIVATFTLSNGATATVNSVAQVSGTTANNFTNTVTYIVTSSDNNLINIWKVTIIGESKKYFTYKEPVTAYFIKFSNGDMVAYTNKRMAEYSAEDNMVHYVFGSELDENLYATYNLTGSMVWEYPDQPWDDWLSEDYKPYEFPLQDFGDEVSHNKNFTAGTLFEIYHNLGVSSLPDNVDVSDWYVRSEKVMSTMCNVFEWRPYGEVRTYWVDLATGLTLKYKRVSTSDNSVMDEYEVTELIIGFHDKWARLHLCPDSSTDVVKPGF